MNSFEQKAIDYFGEIVINKSLIHQAGFGSRAIPIYVGEWIISNFISDGVTIDNESRSKIADFIQKYVPTKGQKESIKNKMLEHFEVKLLDNYSVYINLDKGDRYLTIPFLDETSAYLPAQIV
jgi:ATP-dependent Lon protease